MRLIRTAEHLAAAGIRLGFGTAAHTVGFAKGLVTAGLGLVVGDRTASRPTREPQPEPQPPVHHEPDLPGPDIVLAEPPDPADLPEPIVIEADDEPAPETGEAFQTEPKATTRSETIGGTAEDVLEAQEEAEEALEELD